VYGGVVREGKRRACVSIGQHNEELGCKMISELTWFLLTACTSDR
jgi:hypothetical protein